MLDVGVYVGDETNFAVLHMYLAICMGLVRMLTRKASCFIAVAVAGLLVWTSSCQLGV